VISLAVLVVLMVAAFNLQKFPGFRGTTYHAELADASGLRKGQMVQIAGTRVGRVSSLRIEDDKVVAEFDVDPGVEFGPETGASVEVLNLLGEKYLELQPAGSGQMEDGGTIPLERTAAAYDIVGVLGDLTTTTEQIDDERLQEAFAAISETLNSSSTEIESSFTGLSRLSRTIASRDRELAGLLDSAESVSGLLAERRTDLVALMKDSSLVFDELDKRRAAIDRLLRNARALAVQLKGLAEDNEDEIGPALEQLAVTTTMLKAKKKELRQTAAAMGPYVDILGIIVGTGPWFDAYLANLVGLASGEFAPGGRPE
jgi:phospholipid/cholesterol/gamma-HCH transport system substrate-binding protein